MELGSGPGTDWKILNKTYKTTGSDYSTEFINHLNRNNPQGTFLDLDAITLETDSLFDGIFSNKVLQHLTDNQLLDSIKNQSNILNPSGIICHSFWKGEGDEVFKGLFVNYQTESTLREFFKSHVDILFITTYKEFEADDSLLIIARKN